MGGLIQTKGTQRLARWLNNRFDASATGMSITKGAASSHGPGTILANFDPVNALSLSVISENFIAQYAGSGWPTDWNDLLYPSATMIPTNPSTTSTLQFALAPGAAIPTLIAPGATVSNLTARQRIPSGTVVGAVTPNVPPTTFRVTLVDKSVPPNPVAVPVVANDLISFAKGRHERLVRRWRWYLKIDLKPENDVAIRNAIFTALSDGSFKRINFQTVEDKQRVLVTTQQKLNNTNDELDDEFHMYILLLTESTTAPEQLDPQ
jgi:hypothetical protein